MKRPAGGARPRITRRGIQIALGLLWYLDGLMQLQPAMLTGRFADEVLRPAGAGQPAFVSAPVRVLAQIILHNPVSTDVAFAVIQLALGIGILYPRATRWALAASVAWALSVWYLGEGLGGIFGSGATMLTGAPGAALLYAILACGVAPQQGTDADAQRPARWLALAWALIWLAGAVRQLLPGSDTNTSVGVAVAMNASGAPAWLAAIDNHLSALVPYYGVSIVVDLVVLQAFAGVGVLLSRRITVTAVSLGLGLSLVYWVAGQDMGGFWSGTATDPNTAPLVMLLAIAVLGAVPWRQRRSGVGREALVDSGERARAASPAEGSGTVLRLMAGPAPRRREAQGLLDAVLLLPRSAAAGAGCCAGAGPGILGYGLAQSWSAGRRRMSNPPHLRAVRAGAGRHQVSGSRAAARPAHHQGVLFPLGGVWLRDGGGAAAATRPVLDMGQFAYVPGHPMRHVERERRGRQFDDQRQDQRFGGRLPARRGGDVEPCIDNQQGRDHRCRGLHPRIQPKRNMGGQVSGQHQDQVK
ncbi:MAG: hypothetical protein ACLQI7_10970, partial [Streptosporangiaceae bacterium]